MVGVLWDRYPAVAENDRAREWLQIQADVGLAHNTVEAYGRSLDGYLCFCADRRMDVISASRSDIAAYVSSLGQDPNSGTVEQRGAERKRVLSNATIQLRLTAVRLFYDYLVEEGLRLVLEQPASAEKPQQRQTVKPSAHDLLKDLCGIYKDGPSDLSTNPKYFDDFGR